MNYILMACGVMLLPGPTLQYKRRILQINQTKSDVSMHVLSDKRDDDDFRSIIIGLSIACSLINATLRSGQGISMSYDLAIAIQSQQIQEIIANLLLPRPSFIRGEIIESHIQSTGNKITKKPFVSIRGSHPQDKILESIQSQLHIYYELALIRGANLQDTMATLSERMQTELGNLSIMAAERSSVKLAGPLTLCFLPAFIFFRTYSNCYFFSFIISWRNAMS